MQTIMPNRNPTPTQDRFVERKRTPVGKLGAWLSNKAAGTVLQSIVNSIFFGPAYFRLPMFIAVSIALGAVIDLTIQQAPATAHITTHLSSPTLVAAIAGGGAGGLGGTIVGGLWGWFVEQIGDTVTSEAVSEPAVKQFGEVLGWIIAAIVGWLGGMAAARAFEAASTRSSRIGKFLKRFVASIVIISYIICVYQIVVFFRILGILNGWDFPSLPVIAPFILWALIILGWLASILMLIGLLGVWYSPPVLGKDQTNQGPFVYSTEFSLWCIWVFVLLSLTVLYANASQAWGLIGFFFLFWQFFESGFAAIARWLHRKG